MGNLGWFFAGMLLIAAGLFFICYIKSRKGIFTWKNIGWGIVSYSMAILTVNVSYLSFWEEQPEAGGKLGLLLGTITLVCLYVLYRILKAMPSGQSED